jgi:hypothetical protein
MRNIFLLYMPPGNAEAMVHYQDTIRNKVAFDRIAPYVSSAIGRKLQHVFEPRPIAVWGSRDTKANRSKFDRMSEGDEILIVEEQTIKLLGRVAAKDTNPDLSRELWKNLRGDSKEGWDLIYFIANPEGDRVAIQRILPAGRMARRFSTSWIHERRARTVRAVLRQVR